MWRRRVRSRIDCPVRTRAGRPRPESWPALRPPGPLATETPTSPPRTPRAPQAPTAARGSWFEASPDGQEDKRKFPRSMPWTRQPTRTSQTPEVCHRRSVTLPDRRNPRTENRPDPHRESGRSIDRQVSSPKLVAIRRPAVACDAGPRHPSPDRPDHRHPEPLRRQRFPAS